MKTRNMLWAAGLVLAAGSSFALAGTGGPSEDAETVAAIRDEFKQAKKESSLGIDKCLGWIERLYVVADGNVGSDAGFDALELVVEIGGSRKSGEIERAAAGATERIVSGYSDDVKKIGPLLERANELGDDELVDAVLTRTKSDAVKATCLSLELRSTAVAVSIKEVPEERAERAIAIGKEIIAEYGDELNHEGAPFKDVVAGDLFEVEHLRFGQVAPDIEGADLDGVPFKLSDYRGKVVVLDFWGNW